MRRSGREPGTRKHPITSGCAALRDGFSWPVHEYIDYLVPRTAFDCVIKS